MKHALASAMLGVGLVFSLGTAKADVLVLTSPQIADNGTLAVKRKNAVIKITGACTLSKEPYPFPDIGPACPRIRRLGLRTLPVGHRLDACVRRRQLRASR